MFGTRVLSFRIYTLRVESLVSGSGSGYHVGSLALERQSQKGVRFCRGGGEVWRVPG